MNRQEAIDNFIDWYAETSTAEENLAIDVGAIFDYFEDTKMEDRQAMVKIANIAHHGALLGYGDKISSMNEIRKLSINWWDKEECEALQLKDTK